MSFHRNIQVKPGGGGHSNCVFISQTQVIKITGFQKSNMASSKLTHIHCMLRTSFWETRQSSLGEIVSINGAKQFCTPV